MDINDSLELNISSSNPYVLNTRRKIALSLDIILFVVGFFGNSSVICLTLRHKDLRSIPNLMITNLAVGDLLVIVLVIFFNLLYYFLQSVRALLYRQCEFFMFIQFLSQGVSVLTLTALSVDRFTTVAYPMHKQQYARKCSMWTVAAIWTTSFIIVCPMLGIVDHSTCWFAENTSYTVYILSLVFFLYLLPPVVMMICYYMTARELLHRNDSLKLDPRGGHAQQKKRSRLAAIVVVMTITFILCSSLLNIWFIVYRFSPNSAMATNIYFNEIKAFLMKFNSAVNPVILYLMSSTYRRYLTRTFGFCFAPTKKPFQNYRVVNGSITYSDFTRQTTIRKNSSAISLKLPPIREEDTKI